MQRRSFLKAIAALSIIPTLAISKITNKKVYTTKGIVPFIVHELDADHYTRMGIKVTEMHTRYGTLRFINHPLFKQHKMEMERALTFGLPTDNIAPHKNWP